MPTRNATRARWLARASAQPLPMSGSWLPQKHRAQRDNCSAGRHRMQGAQGPGAQLHMTSGPHPWEAFDAGGPWISMYTKGRKRPR
eukprot:9975077-Lingulodinium_polyedra.AAC.1